MFGCTAVIFSPLATRFTPIEFVLDGKEREISVGVEWSDSVNQSCLSWTEPVQPVGPRDRQGKEEETGNRRRTGIARWWPGEIVVPTPGSG